MHWNNMIISRNCVYLLLFAGVQCSLGLRVPRATIGPLNWSELTAAIEETNGDPPGAYDVQNDTALKVHEETQTSISIREYEDAANNFTPTYDDELLSVYRINYNALFVNDISINNVGAENRSKIVLTNKFKDKIERVRNQIDKFKITLITDNDIKRSKRSVVTSTSTTTSSTVLVHSLVSRLNELEDNIRKMKANIEEIKSSPSLADEDIELFSILDDRATSLQNLVDNKSRATGQQMDKVKSTVDSLSNSINKLNGDFDAFKQTVEEKVERSLKQKNLPTECIVDIQSRNYGSAEEKLNSIDDENKINFIVHQVYNSQAANFYILMEFGDIIRNISRRFLMYKALNYEMESNGQRDPSKMIRLIESLKTRVFNQLNAASVKKRNAESLISYIRNAMKVEAKGKLKEGMLYDHYASVANLAKTVYDFDNELFKELIAEVVNEVHGNISIEELIRSIPKEARYVEQAALAYFAVLDVMQRNDEFNTQAIFKVAYGIKTSIGSDNANFLRLKDRLPISVRNAVFAVKVCIKNVMRSEYLYSARVWGRTYDRFRGYVYTWISGAKVTEADWLIEPDGDNFYIRNKFRKEYLYSARPFGYTFNTDRGYVFTWIPQERIPEGLWKIEPDGDNCYIKNVMRNEYLYSARMWGQTYDSYRGYVYTWIPGYRVTAAEWIIEDCT